MKPLRADSSLLKQEVLREPGFLSWDDHNPNDYHASKRTSPYLKGDIIQFCRAGADKVEKGLIACVTMQYSEHSGDWNPVYRTRPMRKDGKFAQGYIDIWPGYITRAETKLEKEKANAE